MIPTKGKKRRKGLQQVRHYLNTKILIKDKTEISTRLLYLVCATALNGLDAKPFTAKGLYEDYETLFDALKLIDERMPDLLRPGRTREAE